jgi:hypothetical protein
MSSHAPASHNPLEAAANQMRDLCREGDSLPARFDAGSVGRMLVHIDNINRSVTASTQDHVNASKRLNDFAVIFERFARDVDPPDGPLAVRMASVSSNLRAASEKLAGADALPEWTAVERADG